MQLHQAADALVDCGQADPAFGLKPNLLTGRSAEGGHGLQTFAEGGGERLGIYFTFTIAAGTVGFHLLTSSSEKRLTWQGENGRKEFPMANYNRPQAGEWIRPVKNGYKMMCCDCGLVHVINFRLIPWGRGRKILFQAFRHTRATSAARRRIQSVKIS